MFQNYKIFFDFINLNTKYKLAVITFQSKGIISSILENFGHITAVITFQNKASSALLKTG